MDRRLTASRPTRSLADTTSIGCGIACAPKKYAVPAIRRGRLPNLEIIAQRLLTPKLSRVVVGVPKETARGERRVALVPEVARKLTARGIDVVVEAGAGSAAIIPDALYVAAGARIAAASDEVWRADVVVKVAPPSSAEIAQLAQGSLLVGFPKASFSSNLTLSENTCAMAGHERIRVAPSINYVRCSHGHACPVNATESGVFVKSVGPHAVSAA